MAISVYRTAQNHLTFASRKIPAGAIVIAVFFDWNEFCKSGFPKNTVFDDPLREKWLAEWTKKHTTLDPTPKREELPEDPSAKHDREALAKKPTPVSNPKRSAERPMCPLLMVTPLPNSWGR